MCSSAIQSYDDETIDREVEEIGSSETKFLKVCLACGKKFVAHGRNASRQKYCKRHHYVPCGICGKPVNVDSRLKNSTTNLSCGCCREHSNKLKHIHQVETLKRKYGEGVTNSGQIPGSRKKAVETSRSNGAIDRTAELNRQRWKEKSAKDVQRIVEKRKKTSLERYGTSNPAQSNSVRKKIRKSLLSESSKSKYEKTSLRNYGAKRPAQSQAYMNSRVSKYVSVEGVPIDSSYELMFYNFLLSCGYCESDIERNVPVEYEDFFGKSHVTFIDFKIEGQLFEVKGSKILNNLANGFDWSRKLDTYRKNNVRIVTDELAKDVFDTYITRGTVESGSLVGVDVSIFSEHPVFPLGKNRPISFYQTRVSGNRSSYEAFYDPSVRWKMVLNRIKYRGGFITCSDVLKAMNITRTCKQPSWFSKSYARKLVSKYCTSNVIVDPFAGWGTRCDASIELGRYYVGIDLNDETVEWHHFLERNITLGDAEKLSYFGNCSVLTCPPYGDKEVYFKGMKVRSESDWIRIVMRNVPNAREYVFVCGQVDTEFQKYVVETKKNRHYFGDSYEYVVVVPGTCCDHLPDVPDKFVSERVEMMDLHGNVLSVDTSRVSTLRSLGWKEA